jgi:hypothetical protein
MSDLPKILNTPITIKFGEISLLVKRAGIYDLADLQEFMEGQNAGSTSKDERILPHAVYLCAKKVYPEITQEYINDLIPASLIMGNPGIFNEMMVKMGFILPPKTATKPITEAK